MKKKDRRIGRRIFLAQVSSQESLAEPGAPRLSEPGAPRLAEPGAQGRISSRLSLKRRGEVAEAAFLLKAGSMGFSVAKPWGDSDPYDFILQSGSRCWRVQVKSAYAKNEGGYCTSLFGGTRRRGYTCEDIDFLIAYAVPEDAWYVVPVEVFKQVKQIRFYCGSKTSRYEKYREAWCLMACPRDGKPKAEIEVETRCEDCPRGDSYS